MVFLMSQFYLQLFSSVKAFGKSNIRDKCLDTTPKIDFVLIQTSAEVTGQTLPHSISIPGQVGPWPVHIFPAPKEHDEFQAMLLSFLDSECKSIADITSQVVKGFHVWLHYIQPNTKRVGLVH